MTISQGSCPWTGQKQKSPDLAVRGFQVCGPLGPPYREDKRLLGCGCTSGCGSSCVGSGLGSVSSRSSFGRSRSGGSGFGSGRSGSSSRCLHCRSGSRCRSGLFLLAAGGEGSSSNQGGQNERILHFDFPIWTDRILKSHGVRLLEAPARMDGALGLHHFGAAMDYIGFQSIVTNTDETFTPT